MFPEIQLDFNTTIATTTEERYIIRVKKTSGVSCEIDDFVETHLCMLCGIPRSHVLRGLCDLIKDV